MIPIRDDQSVLFVPCCVVASTGSVGGKDDERCTISMRKSKKEERLTSTETICILTFMMTVNPDPESAVTSRHPVKVNVPIRSSLQRGIDFVCQGLSRWDRTLSSLHRSVKPGRSIEKLTVRVECGSDSSIQPVRCVNKDDISLVGYDRRWPVISTTVTSSKTKIATHGHVPLTPIIRRDCSCTQSQLLVLPFS